MAQNPNFLIIGAMKSGTTSLFKYLALHPSISMPVKKELHYYDRLRYTDWNLCDYISRFPEREDHMLSGEATPFYLRHPHAPRWVKNDFPEMKVIIILRNPTARAYSHYQQRYTKGKETRSLYDAMNDERQTLEQTWARFRVDELYDGKPAIELSYLSRGRYLEQIQQWLEYFSRNRILVIFSENLLSDHLFELNKIAEFLSIDSYSPDLAKHIVNSRSYKSLDSETKSALDAYFEPYNDALFSFLDMDSPWA